MLLVAILVLLAVGALGALIAVLAGMCVNITDRGEPFEPTLPLLHTTLREWVAHLLMGGFFFPGLMNPPPIRGEAAPGRVPILLVHGYAVNRGCFLLLERHLKRQGWDWVWSINNQPYSSPIPTFARNVAAAVEELKRVSGAEQVDIIGHSMGGVIAAWYINRLDGHRSVRRLITLGTPWRGTKMSVWGRRREARDLDPRSEVIADIAVPQVPVTALWSVTDHLVCPITNGLVPGITSVELDHMGHLDMLFHPRVYPLVERALLEPVPT